MFSLLLCIAQSKRVTRESPLYLGPTVSTGILKQRYTDLDSLKQFTTLFDNNTRFITSLRNSVSNLLATSTKPTVKSLGLFSWSNYDNQPKYVTYGRKLIFPTLTVDGDGKTYTIELSIYNIQCSVFGREKVKKGRHITHRIVKPTIDEINSLIPLVDKKFNEILESHSH